MAKVSFRTNAELKSIIGKDLITDDNIAVLELVKNSFDAGSKKVDIIFKNVIHGSNLKSYKNSNESKILISDIGKGMSQFDIENKWLNIAYSEKKEKKEEYGRTLAGNKGVGRFSCDRLGKYLTIYTKQKKDLHYKQLSINWIEFERKDDINLNIQDIQFDLIEIDKDDFFTKTNIESFESGTVLEIKSLREEWDYQKILSLKRQLERLINPNQNYSSLKFDIIINASEYINIEKNKPDYEKINGIVKNQIFEKLNFKVTSIQSKISKDGDYLITILKDRGNTIFTLVEKNRFRLLRNIKTHIYYLNTYSKAYFTKQTGIRPIDFGSISLFINGFRIPPYGDYGDDWLGMEIRKGQGRNRYLGTREVIGRIEVKDNDDVSIDDEDGVFKVISSRSGLINNAIYNELAKSTSPFGFFYKTFRRLERFVVEGINWDSTLEKNTIKIEQEILNNVKWDESKERYSEDSLTRNKRIYNVVHNIIDAKKEELIKLTINKNFVSDLIDEQKDKINNDLEFILEELKNKNLKPNQLQDFLSKLTKSQDELNDFEKSIGENDDLKKLKSELENNLTSIKVQKEELEKQLKEAEDIKNAALEKAKQIADELALEKEKNTYLLTSKRTLSEDAKGLIHNVKQTSKKSKQNAQNLYDAFLENTVKRTQALKWLSTIIYNSDKALKISNLITRANFKANSDYQDVNIVKFIEQYLDLYNIMFEDNDIAFSIESTTEAFWKRISILDISLVLDDLISNSFKAKAKNVKIYITEDENLDLKIIFSDDGEGLSSKFENNSDVIFDLGITTTDGSGIGLNYVRNTLSKMKGNISFIGNNKFLKGASFEILISKLYK
ncbi:histidine kinase/DNA gyrase B/HSP90-like ATPase [Flavobacterium cutihirudinis]|uniref:Histidine kinase/DNA gyrase B/HSP90-like ATPase n=1 Tax=Flavobacterium cutihirudinis TaxID=1265740 RepID=A0A3D9FYL3_9FLAO|nr:ATP-binding protein [Flavobacterium cutihirudinis]RED25222.1 histidine kinase/DNA gyrase B/HSP90-like ATPase [Flavobacterium cutihirudinis]